jgi:hypothetical protein
MLVAIALVFGVSWAWAADPDLENDYTLVKSVTFGDGADFAASGTCAYTAYDTGNKKQQTLTILTEPEDAAGWIALQAWANGGSGKGWWNRTDNGLYCYNAGRSACVFGDDLTTGWLVIFECTQTASNVMTLTNAAGEPDGTFSYVASEDGKSYFCTITATENAYVGFCGNKNAGYISKISVYKPNKAVVLTTYTVNYVDMGGNTLKESATYDAIGGAEITLSDADKANIIVGDDTYVYDSDDTEGKTVAEDGSSVVTVKFHKAQNFNYIVNEMCGGFAARVSEGFSYETANVTAPYRKYNAVNGQLYTKGATNKEYNYTFKLTQDNQVENIDYEAVEGVTDVVFLTEGEDIVGLTPCSSPNTAIRSSNSASAYAAADTRIAVLGPGTYKLHAIIYDASKTPDSHWIFKAGETEIADFNCTTVNIQEFNSEEFTVAETCDFIMAAAGSNNMGLDALYITGTGEVTVPEDTYTLVGNCTAIFGKEWDTTNSANDMVKGEDGIYTKTYEGVELTNGYKVEYKVVKNNAYENGQWPLNGNQDYTVWEGDGKYDVTFTFDLANNSVSCNMVKQQPASVTATFNFADPNFRENIGEAMTDTKGYIYNETFTAEGATLQITGGSAPSRVYVDANRGQCLVTYKEYTTLTFKAPEGKAITKIEFTAAGNSNIKNFTASSGAIENMTWTGNAAGVRFLQGGTSYLANAIVTIEAAGDATEALPAIEYTECANIAAFNALEAGTYAKITLTDAEVIGKSADGYSTVWVQDATGGAWIQYTSLNDRLQESTKVNGTVYTIKRANSGNSQLKEAEATINSEIATEAISAYTIVEGTIEEVNVAANLNKVVKISGATLTMTSATAGNLKQGEVTINVNNGNATANQQLHKIADWEKDKVLENITITAILIGGSSNQLLPISIELSAAAFTATFKNDADPAWEAVYAYTWTGEGESKVEQLGAWPGTQLTANAETGLYEVSGKNVVLPEFIIFNNNEGTEAAPKAQTVDLAFEEGKEYFYWGEHEFAYQKYLVQNLSSEKFWAQGNDWGTRASLVSNAEYLKLVPIRDGKYNIESQVNNGGTSYYFNGDFMDSNDKAILTISRAGILGYTDEEESIPVYAYTIANGDNYYGWDGTSTVLGKNLAADSDNALWIIASLAEAKAALAEATVDDPMDATFFIEDRNFGRNNRYDNRWEGTGLHKGGDNSNLNTESYMAAFDVYQTLSEVPNGVYELKAQAAVTYHDNRTIKEYDGEGAPVIYANAEASDFIEMMAGDQLQSQAKMSAQFSAGEYQVEPVFVQVTDGTLKVGAKCERADIWAVWDNFTLTYYGADATIDQVKNAAILAELEELREQAAQMIFSEEVEVTAVSEALEKAYNESAEVSGTEAINAAIEALKEALDKGEASILAKNVLPKMKQLTESTNVYTQEAYDEYYGQWYQKYEAGTLTKAEASALQDPFVVTGWHASITVDNFLLSAWDTNPDFQDAPYYINTWSVEGENDGSNFKVPFFEYWTGDGDSLGERTLTATMNGVAAGWYDVTALVRVRAKNGYTAPAFGIKMQANDGDMTDVCSGEQIGESQYYLATFTAKGEVGEDGVLKIRFIVAADNNISWLAFQNVNFATGEAVEYHYTVAGAFKANEEENASFFGTAWDVAAEANDLVKGGDGLYTKKFENVELEAGTILYKVVRSHSWDFNWGFDGNNADYVVNEAGKYNITFIFNPAEKLDNGFNLTCVVEDATATGISAIAAEAQNGNVYNLNGQKVEKVNKGLYIVNGQKVVMK